MTPFMVKIVSKVQHKIFVPLILYIIYLVSIISYSLLNSKQESTITKSSENHITTEYFLAPKQK